MIRLLRLAFKVALALLGVVVLYVAVTFVQVWWTGRQDQDQDGKQGAHQSR